MLRPAKISYAQMVLRDESVMGKGIDRISKLQKELPLLTDLIYKVSERLSVINFCRHLEFQPHFISKVIETN